MFFMIVTYQIGLPQVTKQKSKDALFFLFTSFMGVFPSNCIVVINVKATFKFKILKVITHPIWPPVVTKNSLKAVKGFICIIVGPIQLKLHRNA